MNHGPLDIFHFIEWETEAGRCGDMARNMVYTVGGKGRALGSRLCLTTPCSEGRADAGQMWPGSGTLAGWRPLRAGRHGERELLSLEEGNALLVVGKLVDEHMVHGGLPLIEHVLTAEHLEDGYARPQGLKISVLGEEPRTKVAGADLCPGLSAGHPSRHCLRDAAHLWPCPLAPSLPRSRQQGVC